MSSASWPDEGGAPPPRGEDPPSTRVPRSRLTKVLLAIAAVIVLVTLAACTAWALLLGRGPLERLLGWVARRVAP